MKAAGLLVISGVVASLCGSCYPVPVVQQVAPVPLMAKVAKPRLTSCSTLDTTKIVELDPGFVAAVYGQCPWNNRAQGNQPATPCPNPPIPSQHPKLSPAQLGVIQGIIASAFGTAPQHLQDELCTVDNIFIDTDPGSMNSPAWGMLDRSRQNAKYIGLSAGLFADTSQGAYTRLETNIVEGLLYPQPDPGTPPLQADAEEWLNNIWVQANDSADTIVTSTLAVLAHEMGHIIWWNEDIPDTSCLISQTNPSGIQFPAINWLGPINNPHGFHRFGKAHNRSGTDPSEAYPVDSGASIYSIAEWAADAR